MADFGVAVVGTGGVAANHIAALGHLPDAWLVGVCDVVEDRAQAAAAALGPDVRWTTALEECLAWPDVDGVIVCTPNDTHVAVGGAVLAAGRHLLMEKPLALDLAGADQLIEAADRAGVVLMPGQTHRFYDPGQAIQSAIGTGAIGDVRYARMTLFAGWIWGGWGSWVLDPGRSGGHVLHNGIHGIDLVTWWLGSDPVEATAQGFRGSSQGLAIDDHFHVAMRHRSGAVSSIEISRAARPRSTSIRESVVAGTAGVIRVLPGSGEPTLMNDSGTTALAFDAQNGFDREVGAWVAAARDGAPLPVDAAAGRLALAASIAAQRSLDLGRPIRVVPR